jgi:hypothetical protein
LRPKTSLRDSNGYFVFWRHITISPPYSGPPAYRQAGVGVRVG